MKGIHDGPDCTTWPDGKPDPRRGRALIIVVSVLAIACGVYAGVQDGPEGVDPLGDTAVSVILDDGCPFLCESGRVFPHSYPRLCSADEWQRCDSMCEAQGYGPAETCKVDVVFPGMVLRMPRPSEQITCRCQAL